MPFRTLLALAALSLLPFVKASPTSVGQGLLEPLQALEQTCPASYVEGYCLRVPGTVISVAGRIFDLQPDLIPAPWRDGPELGLSTDIEEQATALHLVPRGNDQVLLVLQPRSVAATAATVVGPTIPTPFTIDNPGNHYFVVLDANAAPVTNIQALPGGTYTMITSGAGRVTQRSTLIVASGGLTRLSVPRLSPAVVKPGTAQLTLPQVSGYVFLLYTSGRTPILDVSELRSGYYDVLSFLNGVPGPAAYLQELQAGSTTSLQFNGAFSPTTTVATPVVAPASPPSVTTAPSSGTSGMCYVNGYRRSNGTYVSGYYRRC